MTSQVAVINKLGIALATDSAASIYGGRKVFHANKLFALSKQSPVGIMVYGNAEFFGIPWETIIKMYRKSQGNNSKDTLEQYAQSFISFLDNFSQEDGSAGIYWGPVLRYYFKSQIFKTIPVTHVDIKDDFKNILKYLKTLKNCIDVDIKKIKTDFTPTFKEVFTYLVDSTKESHPSLDWRGVEKIFIDLCAYLIQKQVDLSLSGIVIAGFGDQEIFPAIYWFNVDGRACGKSRLWGQEHKPVSSDDEGMVFAFAQDDMVQNYMDGIHPMVSSNVEKTARVSINYVQKQINTLINSVRINKAKKQELIQELTKITQAGFLAINTALQRTSKQMSWETCLAITHLPPQELAEMAQSFIKLTCTRRRVSRQAETVGGPVDVAVITKGDGLIWIERKHYFDQARNLQFVQDYINR